MVTGAPGTTNPYCNWQRLREIHEVGALLVRPDGYIAWRQTNEVWDAVEALQQLRSALRSVLNQDI